MTFASDGIQRAIEFYPHTMNFCINDIDPVGIGAGDKQAIVRRMQRELIWMLADGDLGDDAQIVWINGQHAPARPV